MTCPIRGHPPTDGAGTPTAPVVVPRGQPRQPITVYACERCGARAVGEQRCDEPISVNELLGHDVTA